MTYPEFRRHITAMVERETRAWVEAALAGKTLNQAAAEANVDRGTLHRMAVRHLVPISPSRGKQSRLAHLTPDQVEVRKLYLRKGFRAAEATAAAMDPANIRGIA